MDMSLVSLIRLTTVLLIYLQQMKESGDSKCHN